MRSPLSPIAADIAMDDLETKCIASLPFKLPFLFRYVDHIITAVPTNEITTILNTLNSYNHKIKFTTEKESDGKICFLDVLIIREGKKIHNENIQIIKNILLNNNYLINFINHVINNRVNYLHKKNTYPHQLSESNTNTHTYTLHRSKP